MAGKVDQKTSRRMASIRSKDTKVEWMLRRALWRAGLRYRLHYRLPGRPDIVFPSKKLAVFVDGDFWHGHNWRQLKPKLKNDFWVRKIRRNMRRDRQVNRALERMGWHVVRFWERDIRRDVDACVRRVRRSLVSHSSRRRPS